VEWDPVTRPIIATKLHIPARRRGLVNRPRLTALLRRTVDARLTLVSAPAGFGKTTLLGEWLADMPADRQVAWLSIDPADNDPANFWTYVVAALQQAVPGAGSTSMAIVGSPPFPTELLVTTVVNELAEASGDVWLVLDDYHLIDNREVRDGVALLLEHLPAHVHLVIGTRADPDLPLSRWRVRGELAEIRAADLRFTPNEATAYLNDVTELDLDPEQVAALEQRTEGWVAALQLAALSIRGREDVGGFIARFAGNDRYIVDYLVEEVLAQQSDEIREFLLQTAVLDRLTGPLCDSVTGRDDGAQTLVGMERANLFVVPLDDRREWWRYHHLFGDVLLARLLAQRPDLVPLLHERASRWYERHDLIEDAIRHALAARDFNRAAYLMELAAPMVRRHRRESTLFGWLRALPDDVVRRSPMLSAFYGHMLMAGGDLDGLEVRLDDAERALDAGPDTERLPWADTEEQRTLPATIEIYRASLAQARGDVAGTAVHATRALDLAGPDDHLARGGAAGFLGLAAWANGDVTIALETFAQAVASLRAAGNLVDELSSTGVLADMWMAAGRPGTARRLYAGALDSAEASDGRLARTTADLHVGLSEIEVEAGDLDSARRHLEIAAALAGRSVTSERQYRWYVAMALLARADGEPEEAVALLGKAEELFRPGFFPDVRPIPAIRARIWIGQDKLTEAADWAHERGLSTTGDITYLSEFDHLTLVRLLLARHRAHPDAGAAGEASGLLLLLHDAAEASGRAGSLLEIRMLQALAHDAQGHRARAVECLSRARELAPEPDAYVRLFLDEGAAMTTLLAGAHTAGVSGRHGGRVLTSNPAGAVETTGASTARFPSLVDPLSGRELQVLGLLAGELSGPQIARELFVSDNTLRTHTKHIFAKLGVTSRRAAIRRADELGLL